MRPGRAMMSRRYGFTRRNSRSRRLGDNEHDRGDRAAERAAARQARLAHRANQDRFRPGRDRRVQPGTSDRGGDAAAAVRGADADVRVAHRRGPRRGHRQRQVHPVQRAVRGEFLAGRPAPGTSALSGANSSPAGETRPTTKHSHACVWGMEGAGPLLDWLGVQRRHRYARASALDEGESTLTGLLLLDLPDHDSVVSGSAALVDRLVKMVDMLVWVLDPLKYADASR